LTSNLAPSLCLRQPPTAISGRSINGWVVAHRNRLIGLPNAPGSGSPDRPIVAHRSPSADPAPAHRRPTGCPTRGVCIGLEAFDVARRRCAGRAAAGRHAENLRAGSGRGLRKHPELPTSRQVVGLARGGYDARGSHSHEWRPSAPVPDESSVLREAAEGQSPTCRDDTGPNTAASDTPANGLGQRPLTVVALCPRRRKGMSR